MPMVKDNEWLHSSRDDDQVLRTLGFKQAVLIDATRKAFNFVKENHNDFEPPFADGMKFYIKVIGEVRQNLNQLGWRCDNGRVYSALSPSNKFRLVFFRGNSNVAVSDVKSSELETAKEYPKTTFKLLGIPEQGTLFPLFGIGKDSTPLFGGETTSIETWVYLYRRENNDIRFEISRPRGFLSTNSDKAVINNWITRIILDDFELTEDEKQFIDEFESMSKANIEDLNITEKE